MFDYYVFEELFESEDYWNFQDNINSFQLLLDDLRDIKYHAESTYDKHQYYENDIYVFSIHKIHNLYRSLNSILDEMMIGNLTDIYDKYIDLQSIFIVARYIPKHILECFINDEENKTVTKLYNELGKTGVFKRVKKLRDYLTHESNVDVFHNGIPIQNMLIMSQWLLCISEFLIKSTEGNLEKIFGHV